MPKSTHNSQSSGSSFDPETADTAALRLIASAAPPQTPTGTAILLWLDESYALHFLTDSGALRVILDGGDGSTTGAYINLTSAIATLGVGNETSVQVRDGQIILDPFNALGSSSKIVITDLPTVDPASVGQLWNDAGTVKISAG